MRTTGQKHRGPIEAEREGFFRREKSLFFFSDDGSDMCLNLRERERERCVSSPHSSCLKTGEMGTPKRCHFVCILWGEVTHFFNKRNKLKWQTSGYS